MAEDADCLKRVLPRLLELAATEPKASLEDDLVLRLKSAGVDGWPSSEQDAVFNFFSSHWQHTLMVSPESAPALASELCALRVDIIPGLNRLAEARTIEEARALATLVSQWSALPCGGKAPTSLGDWLARPETAQRIEDAFFRYEREGEVAAGLSAALDLLPKR